MIISQDGQTPLWSACHKGRLDIVKFLTTLGAKNNLATKVKPVYSIDSLCNNIVWTDPTVDC